MNRILSLTAITILLSACGNLGGGRLPKSAAGTDLVSLTSGGAANAITSFSPAAGAYTSVPSSVLVMFNSASLSNGDASAVTNYSITCGGSPLTAQSVSYSPGQNSVSVSLPSITGLVDGTLCTFSVSTVMRDSAGNFVSGNHTVSYTISASGQSLGQTGWNEAATATSTASVGTNIGNTFMNVAGSSGTALAGLLLNGSTSINGIVGLWSHGFSAASTTQGPSQGATAGGFSQVTCPAGFLMTGVTGRAGAYVNAIAIVCKTADQSQTYTSPTVGGSGGTAFTLSCPAGQFATDLDGTADSYLESLSLGCR